MDFALSAEQRELTEAAADFARRELNQDLVKREDAGEFPRETWRRCAKFGVQGLPVPAELGGAGSDVVTMALVMEALGYGCQDNGLLFSLNAQMWSVELPPLTFGTPAQQRAYLPGMVSGDLIGGRGQPAAADHRYDPEVHAGHRPASARHLARRVRSRRSRRGSGQSASPAGRGTAAPRRVGRAACRREGGIMDVRLVPRIAGALLFRPTPHRDDRGFFCCTFDADVMRAAGLDPAAFVQHSLSRSVRGVVRGLHVRRGNGEAKLVRCSYGATFDVIVDLRPASPTYRNWESFELRDDEQATLYVPAGCAHGLQALTHPADVCYQIDRVHDPSEDVSIAFDDPELAIPWPLPVTVTSQRDRQAPQLAVATRLLAMQVR